MFIFFFQAEDGIRDDLVTGVQTCALPISAHRLPLVGSLRSPKCSARLPTVGQAAPCARAHCDRKAVREVPRQEYPGRSLQSVRPRSAPLPGNDSPETEARRYCSPMPPTPPQRNPPPPKADRKDRPEPTVVSSEHPGPFPGKLHSVTSPPHPHAAANSTRAQIRRDRRRPAGLRGIPASPGGTLRAGDPRL